VEVENKDSWGWFVEALKYDLGTKDDMRYTIISYQQKVMLLLFLHFEFSCVTYCKFII